MKVVHRFLLLGNFSTHAESLPSQISRYLLTDETESGQSFFVHLFKVKKPRPFLIFLKDKVVFYGISKHMRKKIVRKNGLDFDFIQG